LPMDGERLFAYGLRGLLAKHAAGVVKNKRCAISPYRRGALAKAA